MDLIPVVVVASVGVGGVVLAMNILVTAPPIAIARSPLPSTSAGPSFPASPSLLPFATEEASITPAPVASLTDHVPRFVHSFIGLSDPAGVWTYYLSYPAFITGETPWAVQIDTDIRAEMNTRAAQWQVGPAAERTVKGKMNSLIGSFVTEMLTPSIASWTLTFVDNSLPSGPVTSTETLDYDLSTGQRMVLDDIFIDSESATTLLSNLAPAILQRTLGSAYNATLAIQGTTPQSSNWNNWAITKAGLKVIFDQYQVTPGPDVVSIVVPWSQLTSIMNETGPVARLAGLG